MPRTQPSTTCINPCKKYGLFSTKPTKKSQVKEIDGSFIVKGENLLGGGGNFHVEEICSDDGCRKTGEYLASIDGEAFVVHLAGTVVVEAADSNIGNGRGSNFVFKSGDGVKPVGGIGDDVYIQVKHNTGGKLSLSII